MIDQLKRLAGFTLLGGFAAYSWYGLVAGYEEWRWLVSVAVAAVGASALILVGSRVRSRRVAWPLGLVVVVAMLVAGLASTGISGRLLVPGGWSELGELLDFGLSGVSQIDTPYSGSQPWTRIGIAAGAPVILALSFGAAFWPGSSGRFGRATAIVLLLLLYGTSVTWEAPPDELLRGAILFLCVAAVLWLPRIRSSRLATGALALVMAAAVALPLASRVDASDPLITYTSWTIFGDDDRRTFEWDHTYGPIDWPQEGTELFRVETKSPAYWKTSVLDSFDGTTWKRVDAFGAGAEEYPLAGATDRMMDRHPNWVDRVEVELLALSSDLAISPGTAPQFEGLDLEFASGDGTTALATDLSNGDAYAVESYTPDPGPRQLRRNTSDYPAGLERYTTLLLPRSLDGLTGAEDALLYGTASPGARRDRAPADSQFLTTSMRDLASSGPYKRVYDLAMRLTRNEATAYAATANVKRYLLENYEYDQEVPDRRFPLRDFLFRDRAGYCQQFSGAMAMMLRMAGIPARVVSGFAPGFREDSGTYLVRDTEAHSWVEVYFPDVGWVTVDPTPSAAPARTETITTSADGEDLAVSGAGRAFSLEESADPGRLGDVTVRNLGGEDEGGGFSYAAFGVALLGIGLAGAYWRRRRFLVAAASADAQLREVERAIATLSPGTQNTLLGHEHRLSAEAGPEAGRYIGAIGANRYAPGKPRRPGPDARRAFRSALARKAGLGGWFRALRVIPPGGPRR